MTAPASSSEARRVAWVNASAGVAGDMLLAALIDAGADRLAVMQAWGALGLDGYAATWERVERCGVGALWTNIAIDDHALHSAHDDHPTHVGTGHHQPAHGHRRAAEVIALIDNADLSDRVRADAVAVYRTLAEVEGEIHGVAAAEVELHEVGALDSILDIVGVCAALDNLGIAHLTFSPIAVGHGTVSTAHGVLPNPVPAVTSLATRCNAVLAGVDTTMELATPTGVALLTVLGRSAPMPAMRVESTGWGAGTADPPGRANVVVVTVGELTSPNTALPSTSTTTSTPTMAPEMSSMSAVAASGADQASTVDQLVELTTNVDDTTGEVIAYTIGQLIDVGALDAWAVPIVMKKGRPAHTIHALVDVDDATAVDRCQNVLMRELGTLGVRSSAVERLRAPRDEVVVVVDGYSIRVKRGPYRSKAEHDDVAAAATSTGRSYRAIAAAAEQLAGTSDVS